MNFSAIFVPAWRRWVIFFARPMPVRSPAMCMGLSVFFIGTSFLLIPRLEPMARLVPGVAEALDGSAHGWLWLRAARWTMILGAFAAGWLFQARCLQICYPGFYDSREIGSVLLRFALRSFGGRSGRGAAAGAPSQSPVCL